MNTTTEQFAEFTAQVMRRFPRHDDAEAVKAAIADHKHPFWADLYKHFGQDREMQAVGVRECAWWVNYYMHHESLRIPIGEARIPIFQPGFELLVVVPSGMNDQKAFDLCMTKFPVFKNSSEILDEAFPKKARTADAGSYAIWVRDRVDADEELVGKSPKVLKKARIELITLTERLFLEYQYFIRTGNHMDTGGNWTMCCGSWDAKGNVPCVCWNGKKVLVHWVAYKEAASHLRARQVVA